jgi:hypothetical protein
MTHPGRTIFFFRESDFFGVWKDEIFIQDGPSSVGK